VSAHPSHSRPCRRKPTRAVLAIATVVGLGLFLPTTAWAARSEFFGIAQQALDGKDINGIAAARIRTVRMQLDWDRIEPSQGSFDWTPANHLVGVLASHGIRTVPFVWGSPNWVASSPATPPLDSPAHEQAWRDFLTAAVARYGPGGTYWANGYREKYGAGATPLPVGTWQIWNEPNLEHFWAPGPQPRRYAKLVRISHDPIEGQDPNARILLAGMPGKAWEFLDTFYSVRGIKSDFDAAALHPYGSDLSEVRYSIQSVRHVMVNHGDAATPLWLTEFAWGSAPPDRFGINQGLTGQARMLKRSYELILDHRSEWRIGRLFWYHWRDPLDPEATCSFCSSAGLLRSNRSAKPALTPFKGFTTDTTPPVAHFISPPTPTEGSVINDPTPKFKFDSTDPAYPGATYQCHVDANSFKTCRSPFTTAPLSDGAHSFSVKAIDPAGNESAVVTRAFMVDSHAPVASQVRGRTG